MTTLQPKGEEEKAHLSEFIRVNRIETVGAGMAQLDFIDKGHFEKLFGMDSGYVLNFSNRTFQEFVYEKIHIDIYQKYPGLSKAKILRAIIADSDKITVGKLLLELL